MNVYGASEWIKRLTGSAASTDENKVLKIFVSGDKSQVGKSSCCLGVIAALLNAGFASEEIAYMKPATQCEDLQPVTMFCAQQGVDAVGVGPLVYYSGFTREFLDGKTKSSEEILDEIVEAVDKLINKKPNRKIAVIDGVGYPAVGSIVGCSNADVARALNAPVLLVCPKGVGNAVDSFNLNEAFFAQNGCTVLGAVFNRLPTDGYYSIEKARPPVTSYFEQYRSDKHVYGFIPEAAEGEDISKFIQKEFCDNFDVERLVEDARAYAYGEGSNKRKSNSWSSTSAAVNVKKRKRARVRTREEVEREARLEGAKGSWQASKAK